MGELVSAAPEELRRFHEVAGDTSGTLIRRAATVDGALGWFARSGSAGIGRVPSDLGARLRTHARRLDALGGYAADVADAFASVDAESPQYPDEWPGLVPGENGCPAVSMPTWFGIGNDGGERETFDEPLWTALHTNCEPLLEEGRQGLVLIAVDGVLVPVGVEILEARRRPRPAPGPQTEPPNPPARVPPMAPSQSPVWEELEQYHGRTRTNGLRGRKRQFFEWDYTHGHIEVYDHNGDHIGTADPHTGDVDFSAAVPGRTLGD